ncbi:MAG: hemerythrin domain-containing protein [Streptosporangiaceae bacterium]
MMNEQAREPGMGGNPLNSGGVLTDTGDMQVPHSIFRGEFRRAPGMVRNVSDGDVRRARIVAGHLQFLLEALTDHHMAEDELLWPRLQERVHAEVEHIIDAMESQHARIHQVSETLNGQVVSWATDPNSAHRDAVADTCDSELALLEEHLGAEEREILPVAAQAISQSEWDQIGERAMGALPKDKRMLVLGTIRYWAPPERSAAVESDIPRPVRPFVTAMADRAFRKEAISVHGTATP